MYRSTIFIKSVFSESQAYIAECFSNSRTPDNRIQHFVLFLFSLAFCFCCCLSSRLLAFLSSCWCAHLLAPNVPIASCCFSLAHGKHNFFTSCALALARENFSRKILLGMEIWAKRYTRTNTLLRIPFFFL